MEGDHETTKVVNSRENTRITILIQVRCILKSKLVASWRTHLGPGNHLSQAWNSNWDHSHKAQYFNPKQFAQSSEEFPQEFPQMQIASMWSEAEMV